MENWLWDDSNMRLKGRKCQKWLSHPRTPAWLTTAYGASHRNSNQLPPGSITLMIRELRKKNIKITPARDHLGFPTFGVMFFPSKSFFEPRIEWQKKKCVLDEEEKDKIFRVGALGKGAKIRNRKTTFNFLKKKSYINEENTGHNRNLFTVDYVPLFFCPLKIFLTLPFRWFFGVLPSHEFRVFKR